MSNRFFYVVVEVGGQKCFINRDMDFTDDFETVLKFEKREHAEEFIEKHKLQDKTPKILSS